MSSRKHSDVQENQMRSRFANAGVVFQIRDNSSGAARSDGDGLSPTYYLSCKYRTTGGFSLSAKDFEHDVKQASQWNRRPIWCIRNEHGEDIIAMKAEDFLKIMQDAVEYTKLLEEKDGAEKGREGSSKDDRAGSNSSRDSKEPSRPRQ